MSENRTIGLGIIGTGAVAQHFGRSLPFSTGAKLTAVLSRKLENAQAFAGAFGGAKAYDDAAMFLADPAVELVYIATPNDRHAADALAAIAAGKAVLLEKPFALSAAEAETVFAAAKQRGVFCMEAMWMRFIPLVQEAKRLIATGQLGEIRLLTADFAVPTTFREGSPFFDPAAGGGALMDRGVYGLSLADDLLGPPTEAKSFSIRGATGIDEQASVLLRYGNEATAQIWTSVVTSGTNSATIYGSQGKLTLHEPFYRPHRLTIDRFTPQTHGAPGLPGAASLKSKLKENPLVQRVGRRVQSLLRRPAVDRIEPITGSGYNYEIDEAVRCIREGRLESDIMPHAATVRVLRLMDELRAQWQA